MPITLTTPIAIPQGTRLVVGFPVIDESNSGMRVPVSLFTPVASNREVAKTILSLADGTSDMVARQASPTPGLNMDDPTVYFVVTQRATPTAFTDAMAALRAANNAPAARRLALEAHLLAAGHIDASLTGT